MSNKRKLLIILILAAVLIVAVLTFVFRPKSISVLATTSTLPDTTIGRWDENSIIYSNDRAFVVYDLTSKQAKTISAESKLPDIRSISVSSDQKYVLFSAPAPLKSDALGAALANEGATLFTPVWWVYNVQTGSFTHLAQGVRAANFGTNNDVYAVSTLPDASRLQIYSLPDVKVVRDVKTTEYVSVYPLSGNTIYASTAKNTVDKLSNSGSAQQILNNVVSFSPSADGRFATFTDISKKTKKNTTNLSLINLQKNKRRVIATSQNENSSVWSPIGSTILYTEEGTLYQNNFASSGRQVTYKIKNLDPKNSELDPTLILNDNLSIIHTSNGIAFLAPAQLELPKSPKGYKKTVGESQVEFKEKEAAFFVTTLGTFTAEKRAAVYADIRSAGYNPDLYYIRVIEYTPSGSHP